MILVLSLKDKGRKNEEDDFIKAALWLPGPLCLQVTVLFSVGCYNKNTIDWGLKEQTFISHSCGGWN